MSQIPPEIEALIWSIAESRDPQAIAEFENRFPEHRLELLKRVNAVQSLRQAKGPTPNRPVVFIPTPNQPPILRFGRYGLTAAALAGVAFASYWVFGLVSQPPPAPKPGMGGTAQTGVAPSPVNPPLRKADAPMSGVSRVPQEDSRPGMSNLPVNPNPIEPKRLPKPSEKPLTIHVERANLLTILDGIAAQAGWQLEVAPGTPDPEVRVDYEEVPAEQIVQDMGRRFGFSAFEQGEGKVLIVPARDGAGPVKIDPKGGDAPTDFLNVGGQ